MLLVLLIMCMNAIYMRQSLNKYLTFAALTLLTYYSRYILTLSHIPNIFFNNRQPSSEMNYTNTICTNCYQCKQYQPTLSQFGEICQNCQCLPQHHILATSQIISNLNNVNNIQTTNAHMQHCLNHTSFSSVHTPNVCNNSPAPSHVNQTVCQMNSNYPHNNNNVNQLFTNNVSHINNLRLNNTSNIPIAPRPQHLNPHFGNAIPTNHPINTTPLIHQNYTTPVNHQNHTTPANHPNQTTPLNHQHLTTPINHQFNTTPLDIKNHPQPLTDQNQMNDYLHSQHQQNPIATVNTQCVNSNPNNNKSINTNLLQAGKNNISKSSNDDESSENITQEIKNDTNKFVFDKFMCSIMMPCSIG